jgi:hypothetical protein
MSLTWHQLAQENNPQGDIENAFTGMAAGRAELWNDKVK